MTINAVNLETLDREEYFSLIKMILLSYRYNGFEYNYKELQQIEDIIYKEKIIHSIKI